MNCSRSMRWVWVACAPWLVACSPDNTSREPISANTLALTAQQNVERALHGAADAGSFIAESASLAKALSSVVERDCAPTVCPVGSDCTSDTSCEDEDSVQVSDLGQSRDDFNQSIDDFLKSLKEQVFTEDNLESEDGTAAVYLLGPDFFCTDESSGASVPSPGGTGTNTDPAPSVDSECAQNAQKLQARLRLTSPSQGNVDVALLLTAQKRNVSTLHLRTDGVSLVFDLGQYKASLDALDLETDDLSALSGKVEFEIQRQAELDYRLRMNVLSAVQVTTVNDEQEKVNFSLAASTPSIELRLDGNARQVTGTYNYGAFGVHGPLNALAGHSEDVVVDSNGNTTTTTSKTYTGMIDLLVGGLDGKVVLDGDLDKLNLSALGLGEVTSTLKHDGVTVAALDINPKSGRHFDVTIEKETDGQAAVTFSPGLDLNLLLNFAPLASQLTDLPAYALGDQLQLLFQGSSPRLRLEQNQMRVVSGTLALTSQRNPEANIQVQAGNCLLESGAEAPSHELLGALAAGACK